MTLYISAEDANIRNLLAEQIANRRVTDSGFDVPLLQQNIPLANPQNIFNLGIKVAAVDDSGDPTACLLLPRSSISNTPFRLANSIGLIDSGYRGEVKAATDVNRNLAINYINEVYIINTGARLFQICRPTFIPWKHVILVNELPAAQDNRGAGGFGSTG